MPGLNERQCRSRAKKPKESLKLRKLGCFDTYFGYEFALPYTGYIKQSAGYSHNEYRGLCSASELPTMLVTKETSR